MRFAYADPPYLGCCKLYKHYHPDGKCWDEIATHHDLITHLVNAFPDGWALSATSVSLRSLLPLCPEDVRVAAWAKSFCAFKKGVRPAYAWEPVIFWRGRNPNAGYRHLPPLKGGVQVTPKDFIVEPITLRKGLTGAKPDRVCHWILDLLGFQADDSCVDLFPGTGIMGSVTQERNSMLPL
jgi:hypothetical protein